MPDAPDDKKEAPEAAPAAPQPAHMPLYMSIIYIAASMLLWSTRGLSMYFISANTQQIQGSLGATLTETTWLVAAYMAPFASLTILLLKIRTQFGLRRFAEVAIAVFLVASLLHLLVYDVWSAIPVRFIAGRRRFPFLRWGSSICWRLSRRTRKEHGASASHSPVPARPGLLPV
ncbi:putative multidrug resistance protein b [Brucella neotomae 5K33]|nr:putative multidrug resistance protein b [Brucella neotomae 5K33]